jgi:small subunit ribosomal protein S1
VAAVLHKGDVVEGTVTNTVESGVFVDLGEGVEGLIHTSELSDAEDTPSYLEPGSSIRVRVLNIDEWQHRIALRIEGASESHEPARVS